MGCREDAESLGGSRVAWRAPSRKEVAKQLGREQLAMGRRVSRRAPRAKRTPKEPGGHQAAMRAQGDHKGAELRVARKSQAAWIAPTSQQRASPSGHGALQRVRSGTGFAGALLHEKKK